MIERVYVYRATPPPDLSQAAIVKAMLDVGELLKKHNKFVTELTVSLDGPEIEFRLTMSGHDQWWIKKRIVYPVTQLLTRAGLKVDQARLAAVERGEDRRVTRVRSADGAHNLPDVDALVDHSDMM